MNKEFLLKKIDPDFLELDEIPLIKGDKFNFENFAKKLKKDLELETLEISCQKTSWQKKQDLLEDLEDSEQICFSFAPLVGNVYFIASDVDIKKITNSFLQKKEKISKNYLEDIGSPPLEKGLYKYIILTVLKNLQSEPNFSSLSARVVEDAYIKSQKALCLDISIKLDDIQCHGKIAITPDFRKSWNNHFSKKDSIYIDKLKNNVPVTLSTLIGHIYLDTNTYNTIKEGDFIALDKIYFDPISKNGHVVLQIDQSPIFQAKITKNKIHILDYATYNEENKIMENEKIKNENSIKEKESVEKVDIVKEETISLKNIPIKLDVELAKLSMTMEKLLNLQPGNFLELSTSLDDPISLTVSGKKIATGELVSIGEKIGVRVLAIG